MKKNDFLIPLNGLPHGRTELSGAADKEFFGNYGNTDILDADISVSVAVEKSGHHTDVDCDIEGSVTVECDRCLEPLAVPVRACARLEVKYGREAGNSDDEEDMSDKETVLLPETDADLDLSQVIYDYVCLALPLQRFHPDGECNPEAVKYLQEGINVPGAGGTEGNPFAALQDFLADKEKC